MAQEPQEITGRYTPTRKQQAVIVAFYVSGMLTWYRSARTGTILTIVCARLNADLTLF